MVDADFTMMETSKSTKRTAKGPIDEAAERKRREKKRIQNRNSQKLSREKQASYTRALEHIVNSIDKWDPESADGSSKMIKTMMQLRDENKKLRDMVLRMRKRFLSLSTMAATDAGDCVLDLTPENYEHQNHEIQNAQSHECLTPTSESPMGTEQAASAFSETQGSPWQPPTSTPTLEKAVTYVPKDLTSLTIELPHSTIQDNLTAGSLLSLSTSSSMLTELPPLNLNTDVPNFASSYNTIRGVQAILKTETLIKDLLLGMEKLGKTDALSISRVISPAVALMTKNSPLRGYVDSSGSQFLIEKIIHWRVIPTFENRENIPRPFTPTVLQQHFHHRHPFIDFVPWSNLRDQILLYMGDIDVTQLINDLLQCYVQDVPQLHAALPLLGTYVELVRQCNTTTIPGTAATFLKGDADEQNKIFFSVTSIVQKYGLDGYQDRKLDPVFSKKYPFFDVEEIVTKFPVLSYSAAITNVS